MHKKDKQKQNTPQTAPVASGHPAPRAEPSTKADAQAPNDTGPVPRSNGIRETQPPTTGLLHGAEPDRTRRTIKIFGNPNDPNGGALWVDGHGPIYLAPCQFMVVLVLAEHLMRLSGTKVYTVVNTASFFPTADKILSAIQDFLGRLDPSTTLFHVDHASPEKLRDQISAIRRKLVTAGVGRHLIRNGDGRTGYMLDVLVQNITVVCPALDESSSHLKRLA